MAIVVLDDNPVKELEDIRAPPCKGSVIVKDQ